MKLPPELIKPIRYVLVLLQLLVAFSIVSQPLDSTYFLICGNDEIINHSQTIVRYLSDNKVIIRNKTCTKDTVNLSNLLNDIQWKYSPNFSDFLPNERVDVWVKMTLNDLQNLANPSQGYSIKKFTNLTKDSVRKLAEYPQVVFIEKIRTPKEESMVRLHNLSVNHIPITHQQYGNYGVNVGIKERKFFLEDVDIQEYAYLTEYADNESSSHATDMATLVSGRGLSYYSGQGVSNASLFSSTFIRLLPDEEAFYKKYKILIQNHSYGVGIENYYGLEAELYDQQVWDNPTLIHIFSSGNSGNISTTEGKYQGIKGASTLTGTFKQSKNTLVIGAIQSDKTLQEFSSKGPSFDGRIKPDLVAYGGEGSSDASALVSGGVAYIQGLFVKKTGDTLSFPALKSLLVATAEDLNEPGPDYATGFGNVNLFHAAQAVDQNEIYTFSISETTPIWEIDLDISDQEKEISIALAWLDPPANAGDEVILVADLDLELIQLSSQISYQPWVPDSRAPFLDEAAQRKKDTLNTSELISILNPVTGSYKVIVRLARSIRGGLTDKVPAAITIARKAKDKFTWLYPIKETPMLSDSSQIVRWESTFSSQNGQWTLVAIPSMQPIHTKTILLSSGFQEIDFGNYEGLARMEMHVEGQTSISDTFAITSETTLTTYLNCPDSVIFKWENAVATLDYRLVSDKKDTILLNTTRFRISPYDESQYFITPLLDYHIPGRRSLLFNYRETSTKCFIDNFLVSKGAIGQSNISIRLSGLEEILSVRVLKVSNDVSEQVYISDSPQTSNISITDWATYEGLSFYYVEIRLKTGYILTSDWLPVVLARNSTLLFPNPVSSNSELSIISPEVGAEFLVYNTQGMLIYKTVLVNDIEYFPTTGLLPGLYLYRSYKGKIRYGEGRILIR